MLSLVPVSFDFPTVTKISSRFVFSASPKGSKGDIFILAQIFLFIVCLKLVRDLLELPAVSSGTGAMPEVY